MEEYGINGNSPEEGGTAGDAEKTDEAVSVSDENNPSESVAAQEESVDDILAEIMGDGGYNDDFSGLFARYLGGGRSHETFAEDGGVRQRVEYEAPPERVGTESARKGGFEEKLPAGMRVVYDAAQEEARRPEFTSAGEVRYPTMGSGEAEERVVYDAAWEEQAKKDAAKREARRRDAALMGDSAYARAFVSGGMPMANRGSTAAGRNAVNSRFIDPLSEDEPAKFDRRAAINASKTEERYEEKVNDSDRSDNKNSFFQDGFSVKSGNSAAADGKTYGAARAGGMSAAASEKTETSFNTSTASAKSNGTASSAPVASSAASSSAATSSAAKPIIDDAVLDAFARSQKSDEDFRERWKSEIELAEKRKKERAEALSRQKAEQRAKLERHEAEKKALADDRPGIPLEINGADEAAKVSASNPAAAAKRTSASASASRKAHSAEKGESFGFVYPEDGDFDVSDEDIVEKISTRDIPAKTVMSSADRTVKKSAGERLSFYFKTHFSAEGIRRWAKEVFPQKGDGKGEIVRKLVRIASFIALTIAIIYLIVYFVKYEQRKHNDENIDREMEQTLPSDEIDNAWANIKAKYPDVEFPEGMNINFANTYAINSDVVGYLRIAGEKTNIGTILLQRNGDDNYYLYRDMYGKKSRYGNPYVKSTSSMSRDGLSQNTIIYGHNTHDGLMFHELENYMSRDGYLDAPIVTLDTLFEQTKWKIFAVILTNSTPEADNNYVFTYLYSNYNSKEHYSSVLNGILERSMIHTGVDVNTNDKILTLYTCYQSLFDGGRLVVFARQLRDGETEEINSSKVYYNSNARFPQAYYDAKKMTNPFAAQKDEPTSAAKPTPSPAPATTVSDGEKTTENVTGVTEAETKQASESVTEPPTAEAKTENAASATSPPQTEAGTAAA